MSILTDMCIMKRQDGVPDKNVRATILLIDAGTTLILGTLATNAKQHSNKRLNVPKRKMSSLRLPRLVT